MENFEFEADPPAGEEIVLRRACVAGETGSARHVSQSNNPLTG